MVKNLPNDRRTSRTSCLQHRIADIIDIVEPIGIAPIIFHH